MSTDGTDDVTFSKDAHIAILRLNRPAKLNAVTPEMADLIEHYVISVNDDPDTRVCILSGAGDKAFSVGSDIKALDSYDSPWQFRNRLDYCDAVRRIKKPVIAAIEGYAFGGGLELALSCDIRIASTRASFAAPEIKLGWVGGGGQTALLLNSVGSSNAALMVLTGEAIDAYEAHSWGLITKLCEPTELLSTAENLAEQVAARAPIAAQAGKAGLRAASSMPLENAIQYERDLQTFCLTTDDAAEGREAFKENRTPTFKGR